MKTIQQKEIKKLEALIHAAQTQLDAAKLSKASEQEIRHLEQRVEALEGKKLRWERMNDKEEDTAEATSSKSSGKKKKQER
jgi:hypothetical protein